MKNKSLTPQIRFKGYEDEWQHKLLKEACGSFKYGLNASAASFDGIHKYLRITDIDENTRQFKKDNITSPDIIFFSDEYKLAPNDIVFARTGASVGKTYLYNETDGDVYWAGFLIRANITSDFDSHFVFQTTLTKNYWRYIALSSQRSGQPGVNAEQYAEFAFIAPNRNEQQNIGNYFKQIDEMIANAEREVSRLENMKQASLQKMFPRPGATAPEIRFYGFTEDWHIGKLSDLLEIDDNRNTKNELGREDVLSVSGEFGLVNQIEFQGRSFAGASLHNYKITHLGQVVYTKSPLKAQPFGIVKSNQYGDGILSPLYAVYNTINNACADFIHYYFEPIARLNNYLRPLINKGAKNTILISDETALQGEIIYPSDAKEQFLIADYFVKLDLFLKAKRQKLVKLRNIKQACLDKMFVNTSDL